MCGLFGWTLKNKIPRHSRMRAFRILAANNDFRGGDSYGAFLPDERVVYRGLGRMAHAKWPKKEPRPMFGNRLIAHTRYATHGAVSRQNAHPFTIGNITGAHNGVIFNHEALNNLFERTFEVDSQHIFAHLNEGKPLADLIGYGTITFECKDDPGVIYLGTFGGDIAVARLANGKGIVWSSTSKHLTEALKAAGWPYELIKIEDGKLYQIKDNEIYETDRTLDVRQQCFNYTVAAPTASDFKTYRRNDPDQWDEESWKCWWESAQSDAEDNAENNENLDNPEEHDCDITCGTGSAFDTCPFMRY